MREVLLEWFGEEPQNSPDLCRIVNVRHFELVPPEVEKKIWLIFISLISLDV